MNNVITIDVINAIVLKAMSKNLVITAFTNECRSEIIIYDKENERQRINLQINSYKEDDDKELTIYTTNGCIENVKIESESFILRFKLLVEDCINYSKNMSLKDIESFLIEDQKDNKPTDINDLDNEDD